MDGEEEICCPFCGYEADSDYQIMLHMETLHPENGESPFVVQDDASIAALIALDDYDHANDQYANCPVSGCGEIVTLTELESHVEMHGEEHDADSDDQDSQRPSKKLKLEPEAKAAFDTKLDHALRNLNEHDQHANAEVAAEEKLETTKAKWKSLLKMPDTSTKAVVTAAQKSVRRRLGKSELGPYAHEKQMPSSLVKLLEKDGAVETTTKIDRDGSLLKIKTYPNMTAGVIPVLSQLLNQDEKTKYAYLCDPVVRHVSKLRKEGGFCGYRNIQMLSSYIIGAESQGHEHFNGKVPTIFQIQDFIEQAWDIGINASGRVETGGIRGTRKYIGTPDAQAMLLSIGIACDAQGLKPKKNNSSKPAYELLFGAVDSYFSNGCTDYSPKVRCTDLPPIYFQHRGHSMTIVGIEKKKDETTNVLVFDPMFHDASSVTKRIDRKFAHKNPESLLKAYRRGVGYLRWYKEFELLKLTPPPKAVHINADPGSLSA